MTITEKAVSKLVLAVLIFISLGFMYSLWQMVRPYNIIDMKSLTMPAAVTRGVEVSYVNSSCKYLPIPGEITVYMENSQTYQLFALHTNLSTGCHETVRSFVPPTYLEPGVYRLHFVAVYEPTHFRTITEEMYSNEFELK